jgi:hypothetical protein
VWPLGLRSFAVRHESAAARSARAMSSATARRRSARRITWRGSAARSHRWRSDRRHGVRLAPPRCSEISHRCSTMVPRRSRTCARCSGGATPGSVMLFPPRSTHSPTGRDVESHRGGFREGSRAAPGRREVQLAPKLKSSFSLRHVATEIDLVADGAVRVARKSRL